VFLLLYQRKVEFSDFYAQKKRGSGVGLINVHRRIRLRFGPDYGLKIVTAPDEGTKVEIRLPYIEYTEENRKKLEHGDFSSAKKELSFGGEDA